MALEPSFLGAFIDGGARHRVLGVTLRPLCLWHLLLLQGLESPFIRRGLVDRRDLRKAVGICRLSFPDSAIVEPRRWILSRRGLTREVNAFLAYAGNHLYKPEYKVDVGGAAPKARGQAPDVLTHFADLFGWGQWPGGEAEVWNLPLARAHWYRPMALRARGLPIDFETKHDREFRAAVMAHEAAQAVAQAAAAQHTATP